MRVMIKKLHENARLPVQAKKGSAGYDVHACFGGDFDFCVIVPHDHLLIAAGIAIQVRECYERHVRPRSGLALKCGVTVLISPGTTDHGYLDEIGVILVNLSDQSYIVHDGDRIAQLVLKPVLEMEVEETESFEGYDREGGFGSSGN